MENNGFEIELKFLLEQSLEDFLKKFSDILVPEKTYQNTIMYDNSAGLMQKTNSRIRLRQTGDQVTLSYKLPIASEMIKKEIEWETRIDNLQVGEELLKAMGFKETTSYEKYRTSFNYMGVKIDIDEYPFSNFVEIEGDENSIKKVALELGFDLKKALTKACDTLFNEWRAEKGLSMSLHMKFDNYDK